MSSSPSVAFNPTSILPSTKSAKSLSHLQRHTSSYKEESSGNLGRIDSCTLERSKTDVSRPNRSSSRAGKAPFIAFGVEAYPTRATFDDICYDFVRSGRWCKNGNRCPRIHPIKKDEYLAKVIRESIIYSRMRTRRSTDQNLTPSGTKLVREIDATSTNEIASSDSSDVSAAISQSTLLCPSDPMQDSLARDPERKPFQSRPMSNEQCRRWLRGQCEKGSSCNYIHEEVGRSEKDSTSTFIQHYSSGNRTTIVVLRRGPETMIRTLHNHIRATFASGFHVAEFSTGFESFCVIIGGLLDTSDSEILELVKPFGKVRELRRPINHTPQMTIQVYFEKTSEAFAALVALRGKEFLGRTLDVRPGNGINGNRPVFKGNAVRFEWDASYCTVYMGYSTRRLAEQAVYDAQSKPYGDFMTVANIHVGIPAVGAITVRFQYLPLDVDQDRMKTFGPHQGMVTGKANHKYTAQDLTRAFKSMLKSRRSQIADVQIRGPPYTHGKMKAWVTFANARDAQDAAASFHLSGDFVSGVSISAFHVKSISFALTPLRYQIVQAEIRSMQDRLLKDDNGYWINVSTKKNFVGIQISGGDIKVLGRLKAEFERILNGEPLYDNGKVVWDPYFAGPGGQEFLGQLQQEYAGVTIIASPSRNSIRLLGDAEKKVLVRHRVINFIKERRAKIQYVLPLGSDVFAAFTDDKRSGFATLEAQLGQGNIVLDSWNHRLVISGDPDAYTLAKDAVFAFRLKHRFIGPHWKGETCPACTAPASSPIKLPCGHSWCRSCLRHYLRSSTDCESIFPLACHGIGKKCGEPIPLPTARVILTPDEFEALFQSAFSSYVLLHPETIQYCPTPDCPQVYRTTPEGISMQCPECLSAICTHCHTEAHEGLTCMDVHDGDVSFWEWAAGNNVKRCPKCRMALEKAAGCNHMTCGMCQTHICWVCMQTFEDGLKIYGHMQSEHGGSGI